MNNEEKNKKMNRNEPGFNFIYELIFDSSWEYIDWSPFITLWSWQTSEYLSLIRCSIRLDFRFLTSKNFFKLKKIQNPKKLEKFSKFEKMKTMPFLCSYPFCEEKTSLSGNFFDVFQWNGKNKNN